MRITKTMKSVLLVVAAVVVFSSRPAISAQSATPATPSHPAQIFLTNAQIDPNFPSSIRAFVRTGSLSANCLTTMGDTSFVATGTIVFCAPREPAGLGKGVLVSVFYPQPPSGRSYTHHDTVAAGSKGVRRAGVVHCGRVLNGNGFDSQAWALPEPIAGSFGSRLSFRLQLL